MGIKFIPEHKTRKAYFSVNSKDLTRIIEEFNLSMIENTGPCFFGRKCGAIASPATYFLNFINKENLETIGIGDIFEIRNISVIKIYEEWALETGIYDKFRERLLECKVEMPEEFKIMIQETTAPYQ